MIIVATTSLPAVDRPNTDRWNTARSRQNFRKDAEENKIPESATDKTVNDQGIHHSSFRETGSNYDEEDDTHYENVIVDNDSDQFLEWDTYETK